MLYVHIVLSRSHHAVLCEITDSTDSIRGSERQSDVAARDLLLSQVDADKLAATANGVKESKKVAPGRFDWLS